MRESSSSKNHLNQHKIQPIGRESESEGKWKHTRLSRYLRDSGNHKSKCTSSSTESVSRPETDKQKEDSRHVGISREHQTVNKGSRDGRTHWDSEHQRTVRERMADLGRKQCNCSGETDINRDKVAPASSFRSSEYLKKMQKGTERQYMRDAFKNPKAEEKWQNELRKHPKRKKPRQKMACISKKNINVLNYNKKVGKYPNGSVDRLNISKEYGIAPHQVANQYVKHDMFRKYHDYQMKKEEKGQTRQTLPRITKIQKDEIESKLENCPFPVNGTVDRERFRKQYVPHIRKDQIDRYFLKKQYPKKKERREEGSG